MMFKAVDTVSAAVAKQVLAPFRQSDDGISASKDYIVLNRQRADRLEQAIAEAIHNAVEQHENARAQDAAID